MRLSADFTTGSIFRPLMRFLFPILASLFLQAMYGAADMFAVGRFGTAADVSAAATGSQVMMTATGVISGLSMGASVLIGRLLGQKDHRGASDAASSGLRLFSIVGAALTVLLLVFADNIAQFMQAPSEALEKTASYIRICGIGMLFTSAYNLFGAIFRGTGDSRSPMMIAAAACAVNIALDLFFTAVLGMQTDGVAIATVSAQAVSAVLSLIILKKRALPFSLDPGGSHVNGSLKNILRLGLPVAAQDVFTEISFMVLIGIVNTMGLTASAGIGIAERISAFMLMIPVANVSAVSSFVAQNAGAGKHQRAAKALRCAMLFAIVLGAVMFCALFFLGDALSSVFSSGPSVIAASGDFLKGVSVECLIISLSSCLTGYFNGYGKTIFVMAQGLAATFIVRIPAAYLFLSTPGASMLLMGSTAPIAAAAGMIMCTAYFFAIRKKLRSLP